MGTASLRYVDFVRGFATQIRRTANVSYHRHPIRKGHVFHSDQRPLTQVKARFVSICRGTNTVAWNDVDARVIRAGADPKERKAGAPGANDLSLCRLPP